VLVCALACDLSGCGRSGGNAERSTSDVTAEHWYAETTNQLATMNRDAESLYDRHKADEAAAIMEQARPLSDRLLTARQPTLTAMQAVSDLDDLHGRMLLANRHYGWARLLFQKNVARWKNWQPPTDDSARRLKQAESAIAECDKHIE
jgi:hypothetical protein